MNVASDWYDGVVKKVNGLKDSLSPMDSGWAKFVSNTSATRLDPLLSAAKRIEQFSPDCTQCQIFRDDIDTMMKNAPDAVQQGDKALVGSFLNNVDQIMNKMTRHFQKEHRLVRAWNYTSLFWIVGWIIGMACKYVFRDHFYWWPFLGMGVGAAIGAFLDYRVKKEDRILYKTASSWGFSRNTSVLSWVVFAAIVIMMLLFFVFR